MKFHTETLIRVKDFSSSQVLKFYREALIRGREGIIIITMYDTDFKKLIQEVY